MYYIYFYRSLTDESEQLRDEHRKSHQDFAEATEKIADMEKRYLVSQTALATAEGQLQAYQVSIQNLTAEQAQVKTQLESVTVKLTTQAKELSNLRSTISSKDNQIELLNMKVTDLETFLASTKGKVISYEQATYDIASQIQAYSEYLSSGSYLKSTDFDDSSNKDSRSELFESPMPMSSIRSQQVTIKPVKLLLSASSPYTPGVTTRNLIEAPLEGVTQVFSDLKAKLDFLIEQGSKDKEVAKLSRSECEELRKRVDTYEQSLHTLQVEKDKLLSDYEIVETELTSSKNDAFLLEKEKSAVLSNYRQSTKHIREVVALLANSLHQFELKVSGAVPGSITNTSVDMSLPTSDDSSFDTFASRTTQVVETYVASVSKHIDALSAELTQKQQTVDKVDREHVSKERAWVQERGMFIEQINALESAMEEVKRSSILSNSEAHKYQQETDRLNRKIQEYSSNNAALELEYKYSVENVNELRTTLSEAENICMDLRSKLKSSQLEIEKQSEQVKSLFDQVTEVTSLVASKDLLIEKNATLIHRLQAEKEAVDNVRKSVELELTRVHVELSEAKSNRSAIGDDDSRASFEVEKLMAALTNTLDQIQSTATPVRSEEYATSALTSRVDQAVKRLNDFRNWSRDEKRSKRTVEEKNEALQHEVASARKALENSQNQLSRLIKSSSEMDSASKETLNIINELQADLTEKKEEIKVLQTEFSSRKILLEEEKRTSQQLTVESRTKESRITYLHDQLEEHKRGERRLADELSSLRKDLSESRLLIDNQAEQLKLSKLNGDRLSGSVELLERGLEKERSDRIAAEKRLLNATGISDSTLKLRYVELEATVQSLGMQLRAAEERRDQLDLQSMDLSRELNAQRRIVQSYDTRFEQVVAEKTALQRDLATVHVELTKQAAAVEIERMSRLKTEAALMTFSQAHAGPSSTETMFTSLVEEMQGQIVTEEQEKKILLDQIHKLRVALEEKENARNQDGRKIQRLEGELTSLQSKLSKAGKEVTSASARSTALRAEGRQSRSQIQQVVTQISELVDTVKSDCKTLGIEIHSSESSYPMAPKHDKTSSNEGLGLQEALGIPNLIRASNTLQDVMQYIRNIPRDRIQMQSTVMRVEAERSRLQKDLTATDSRYHETVAKLREEISNQKAQLLLLQSSSDSHPSASQSNSKAIALEKALLQERSEKEGTLEQLERSKAEIETLHKHLIAATQQKSTGAKASIQAPVAGPSDDSKKEIESLRHELQAVSHHRNVLRDSIDKLEKQIKSKSDALTDVSAQLDTLMRRQQQTGKAAITEDELEAMRRQCARFRARANAMEELASLYRGGIVAIYSDGASFGAAQYGDFNLRAAGSSGTGWIEREIGHVKKSYEDEIRLLDGEVSELRSKLRQSNSYISEVRKRFEDNLKTLYKPNSGSRNTELDSLHQQLDHLNSSVDRAESQVLALEGELVREKSSSRNRHAALIGDLSKALQSREAISLALRRAETQKQAPNSPGFNGIATGVHPVEKYQQKTISNLVQGLVETDHELYETERRIKKQQLSSQQQPLTQSQYQSPGKTKTAQQLEQQLTAFRNHHGDHSQSSAPSRQDSKIPGTSNADILNTSISPIKHSSPERRRSVMGGGQPSHSVYRLAGENDSVLRVSRASITPASIATRKNNN